MRRFLIDGIPTSDEDADFQELLRQAYRAKVRPLCLCKDSGVAMYVADVAGQLVVKRLPLSGEYHDRGCPSHEPPYDLSGLGPLIGSAIRMDACAGTTALKLGFSLSKRTARTNERASIGASGREIARSSTLSLRALLHFLWHESGLTEWTALWSGRRDWWQIYHRVMEAAGMMTVRGESLVERLFMPEPFRSGDKTAIEQRRTMAFSRLFQSSSGLRKLILLVGEIKEFAQAREGMKIVIKHMPGVRLHVNENAWRALQRRFETELTMWRGDETSHLVMISTIRGNSAGQIVFEEIALMSVTEQWLPIENEFEHRLVRSLARLRQKSVKGLRFDLPGNRPFASAILLDVRPLPMPLYIVPPDADEAFETALREMIAAQAGLAAWIWRAGHEEMPALPT